MNDTPDDTLPKRRRSAARKPGQSRLVVNEPAVQAILDHALHPETMSQDEMATAPAPSRPPKSRPPRKRAKKLQPQPVAGVVEAMPPTLQSPAQAIAEEVIAEEVIPDEPIVDESIVDESIVDEPILHAPIVGDSTVDPIIANTTVDTINPSEDVPEAPPAHAESAGDDDDRAFVDLPPADRAPPDDAHPSAPASSPEPSHHHWVYLALAVFLLALGFGAWGVWITWFAGDTSSDQSATALSARSDKLSQDVSTLRRSDQISREANRDLERTLAERDEEIAGLRADIAFYERFVGATGQRRGLSVHDLDLQLQSGDAWHFVATLTQNLNRGAVNTGRVTLLVEGTRNDRLEKLSWSGLRKQPNAPGVGYSFKYFQQVEGEILLPKDFKPLRVTVRLVPAGGSAVEQSFPWPETVHSGG
jgi:hypothetical protein